MRKTPSCPDLYAEVVRMRAEGRKGALATIVRQSGSTPRKDNAKMLVLDDGTSIGSVGGGCVEAEVWQAAREAITSGQSRLLSYELTEENAEEEGLICGGTVEVFVDPILPDPRLVIFGAGHLGRAIAELALSVGFQVTVVDDRDSFANATRFSEEIEVVCRPFDSPLSDLRIGSETYVLVVTRGHRHDQTALQKVIGTEARYVGMVGSRRKILLIIDSLTKKGVAPERFGRLYAPIGLDIGSETPEEIAVSVVAELIAIRKGVHRRSEKQEFVLKHIPESV